MQVLLDRDEWYPVYSICDSIDAERHDWYRNNLRDIPEDKIEWIKQTEAEFDKVQKYLSSLWSDK